MSMDIEYWIYQDYFIFKPKFNGSIVDYTDIISNYNKLIFSNYDDLDTTIKKIKETEYDNYLIYFDKFNFDKPLKNAVPELVTNFITDTNCLFNKALGDSLSKLTNLTQINFGHDFNQPLTNSLDQLINLTHITFGYHFNQPLTNSLDHLTNLKLIDFGFWFNQLPIKFCKNFMELQKINMSLFSWETIGQFIGSSNKSCYNSF